MLIQEPFGSAVARTPRRIALVCEGERVSYAQLDQRADRLCRQLLALGVRRGDRVVLCLDNGVGFVVGVYAALRAGAVIVPVSPQTRVDKLQALLVDARPVALLTQDSVRSLWKGAGNPQVLGLHAVLLPSSPYIRDDLEPSAGDWKVERVGEQLRFVRDIAASTIPQIIDQDLAALLYTSGSTGEPKGVMLTHLNMASAARSVIAYLGLRESDVILCALSLAHGYGLYQVLMGLWVGATLVIEKSFAFPAKVLATVAKEGVTVVPGVPAMYARIATFEGLETLDLSAVRILTNAAEAIPVHRIEALRRQFPQAQFYSMYGLTECKRVTYLPPEELDRRPGSVGRGMPNQEHWLIDSEGRRLPNDSLGELVVRGSHVMLGYWDKPDETAKRLRPGPIRGEFVLHTGDIFRTDAEGWLYFVSRSDDIIKSRGEKIVPGEVEAAILAMPGVEETAVVGVPDNDLGLAVKAYVVLSVGAQVTERQIIRHCLSRLESFMAPRSVEFVNALPRGASGKVQKARLV